MPPESMPPPRRLRDRWHNWRPMAVRTLVGVGVMLLVCSHPTVAQDAAARAREAYGKAIELEAAGNDAAALALLWQAAGAAPRDADIQNRLGEALARLGALEAAVDAFTRALAERPGFQKAANNLILTLVQAGRGTEATAQARRLVAAAPDDPQRYFTLGLAQAEQDLEEAIRTFRRVLELAPRHTLARYNLALVAPARRPPQGSSRRTAPGDCHRTAAGGVLQPRRGPLAPGRSRGRLGALRAAIAGDPRYAAARGPRRGAERAARLDGCGRDPAAGNCAQAGPAGRLRDAGARAPGLGRRAVARAPSWNRRRDCAAAPSSSTRRWSGPPSAPAGSTPATCSGALDDFRRATAHVRALCSGPLPDGADSPATRTARRPRRPPSRGPASSIRAWCRRPFRVTRCVSQCETVGSQMQKEP